MTDLGLRFIANNRTKVTQVSDLDFEFEFTGVSDLGRGGLKARLKLNPKH